MLLRLVQGQWPPKPVPANPLQEFHIQLCDAYVQWLRDSRGLAPETISGHYEFASRFLGWLGERAASSALTELTVDDVDSFVAALAQNGGGRPGRVLLFTCEASFDFYIGVA
jgi:site-specific recombinase XerD